MKFENIIAVLTTFLSEAAKEFARENYDAEVVQISGRSLDARQCRLEVKRYNDTVASFCLKAMQIADQTTVPTIEFVLELLSKEDPHALRYDTWMAATDSVDMTNAARSALGDICKAITTNADCKEVVYIATTQKGSEGIGIFIQMENSVVGLKFMPYY